MKRKLVLPRRYIRLDPGRTVALMQKKTGYMQGRVRAVKRDDTTKVRRVIKSVDVNKDGTIDFVGGTILGRTKAVRSSRRAKGYVRRL